MSYEKSQWRIQIRDVEREYLTVRFSLDWLLAATVPQIEDFVLASGEVEPPRGALADAHSHLAATYLVRMDSLFERSIWSFWLTREGSRFTGDGRELLDQVAATLAIAYDANEDAQITRRLRNELVHDRFYESAIGVDIAANMSRMLAYLDRLPLRWG